MVPGLAEKLLSRILPLDSEKPPQFINDVEEVALTQTVKISSPQTYEHRSNPSSIQ